MQKKSSKIYAEIRTLQDLDASTLSEEEDKARYEKLALLHKQLDGIAQPEDFKVNPNAGGLAYNLYLGCAGLVTLIVGGLIVAGFYALIF